MKKFTTTSMVLCALVSINARADSADLLSVIPEYVFTPSGFDDNDNSQVVLAGHYTDTCWHVATPQYTVDHEKKKLFIQNRAFKYHSDECFPASVFYMQPVSVGLLTAAQYEVMIEREGLPVGVYDKMGRMGISRATHGGPDDYLYAPVEEISVARKPGADFATLTVKGKFNSRCFRLDEIRVSLRPGNVYEVLPILSVGNEGRCDEVKDAIPFEGTALLKDLPEGATLIHVRAMNGQAVNRVEFF